MSKFDMSDYVPVEERIAQFREKHPEGSLQSEIVEFAGGGVAVKAYAYRSPDDPRPGVGHAWEPIPGQTPYTKNSELQNAETSAWGRAIVAALAADTKRGIAFREEVRNRQETSPGEAPPQSGDEARRESPSPGEALGAGQSLLIDPVVEEGTHRGKKFSHLAGTKTGLAYLRWASENAVIPAHREAAKRLLVDA